MKVVLLNIKYSPNLGDGVIAECLEGALSAELAGAEIVSCDLAGRESFQLRASRLRQVAMRLFALAPAPVESLLSRLVVAGLLKRSLTPFYERMLAGADAVVIGGGQLFADANLNFPVKLHAALEVAKGEGALVLIHGVGVGSHWSDYGGKLFRRALADARIAAVAVSEEMSQDLWRKKFANAGLPEPALGLDPALLVESRYRAGGGSTSPRLRPRAGLCVTGPETLRLHKDPEGGARMEKAYFTGIAEGLRRAGYDVAVFTNGAAEDDARLRACFSGPEPGDDARGDLMIAPRPVRPIDLVETIRGVDVVIGHRLHANIIAYGLNVPHVGLAWNRKVDAFFELTRRPQFLLSNKASPQDAVAAVQAAHDGGLDQTVRRCVIDQAALDVRRLAHALFESDSARGARAGACA